MKHIFLACVGIIPFVMAGEACLAETNDSFSGTYMGIRGGYAQAHFHDYSVSHNGFGGDLFIGHGALKDQIYVGGEAFLGQDSTHLSSTTNTVRATYKLSLKSGIHYGVRGRVGYQFFEPAIAYLSLGVAMESYKIDEDGRSHNNSSYYSWSSTSKQTPVFIPGVGVQVALSDKVSARFDLEHHLKQGFKFPGGDGELKVSKNTAKIGISFKF